jgi:hypothetical protein
LNLVKVMTSRLAGFASSGMVVLLLASGLAWQVSSERSDSEQARPARPAGQERNVRKPPDPEPPGPGQYLAFDVRPRDYRQTNRYILEITHPSGQLSTHDLKKPKLQRRTIMVPIPALEPGKYQFVVIAENEKGASRSDPLVLEIPVK